MGMTITEKILAEHSGKDRVEPGEIVNCRVDLALGNDITAPLAIKAFYEVGAKEVFDPERVVLVPDHFTPNKDIPSAEQCKVLREFARRHRIRHYYEVGRMGIEHALLPELGLVKPGTWSSGPTATPAPTGRSEPSPQGWGARTWRPASSRGRSG